MYGEGGRQAYNEAAQTTNNEELLLNLVRLRYSDTPYFLELNNITTQFSHTRKIVPLVSVLGCADNSLSLGGELSWRNQPTIQYLPLRGRDFAIQLMRPLSLRLIHGLLGAGWDIDRVLRLTMQDFANFANAPTASGPVPGFTPHDQNFEELVQTLRQLQIEGNLVCRLGLHHRQKGEGNPQNLILDLSFHNDSEAAQHLAQLLSLTPSEKGIYHLHLSKVEGHLIAQRDRGLLTRSLLGCMYFLSLGVELPDEDLARGTVFLTRYPDGRLFNWQEVLGGVFAIRYSHVRPQNAYVAVAYRGRWFFIDERDIESKRTFVLIEQIYNLQANQQEAPSPVFALPL